MVGQALNLPMVVSPGFFGYRMDAIAIDLSCKSWCLFVLRFQWDSKQHSSKKLGGGGVRLKKDTPKPAGMTVGGGGGGGLASNKEDQKFVAAMAARRSGRKPIQFGCGDVKTVLVSHFGGVRCTTHFWNLLVGIAMFTGGSIWLLTHGHLVELAMNFDREPP